MVKVIIESELNKYKNDILYEMGRMTEKKVDSECRMGIFFN
jgi:hypothetical protein